MKKELTELQAILEKMADKIEEREFTFEERSERWQESERGEAYAQKTEKLQEVHDLLDSAIEELNEYQQL